MPWDYQCDVEKDVIYITASGVLTEFEAMSGIATILADARLKATTRILNDYSATTSIELSPEFLHSIGTAVKVQPIAARRAYLVKDETQLKIVTAYLHSVGSEWIRDFTDRAEAIAWLNDGQPPERRIG